MDTLTDLFDDQVLNDLFPPERTDDFFEALFGDADEGAYDIHLRFDGHEATPNSLRFFLDLIERPGCCLACNLTYGLPEVFSRHPVINIKGLVADIEEKLDGRARCVDWQLGTTVQQSKGLYSIPMIIQLG